MLFSHTVQWSKTNFFRNSLRLRYIQGPRIIFLSSGTQEPFDICALERRLNVTFCIN